MTEWLVQITAPHFCAAIVLVNRRVGGAPPILSYMRGWTPECVAAYCKSKGWKARTVKKEAQCSSACSA